MRGPALPSARRGLPRLVSVLSLPLRLSLVCKTSLDICLPPPASPTIIAHLARLTSIDLSTRLLIRPLLYD